ncbi:MAG: hypothetical protein OXD54_15895 [Candidatus Poribacteria bacterium]|nr:hypothetical protein [Candidatus Poribacteria bacterium]
MLIQKIIKVSIIALLAFVVVSLSGLYIYSLSQHEKLNTPEKVYRDTTETEMEIVQENIKSMIREQQERRNQQNFSAQHATVTDDNMPTRNETKSDKFEYTAQTPVELNQMTDIPNMDMEKLNKNESVKIIKADGDVKSPTFEELISTGAIPNFPGLNGTISISGTTFNANSPQELQKLISQLENSDNPNHRSIANSLKTSDIPAAASVTITVSD